MLRNIITFCVLSSLLFIPIDAQDKPQTPKKDKTDRQICITFNDLPVARIDDRIERLMITEEILGVLDEFNIKAAGFVTGKNIGGDLDLLEDWLTAGHILGNQTYSYPDLNDVPPTLYLHNVEKCQNILDSLTGNEEKKKYFRFPYLHYGSNYNTKDAVIGYLDKNGYTIAHSTIDIDDFAYNLQFEKIYETADSLEFVRLGNEYIDHVLERLDAAEELSRNLLGRQIRHVLHLQVNRLNSNFLVDLLSELQIKGYRFISLKEALSDPVYKISDSYVGPKGLSYLERLSKTNPDLLPAREK